MLVMLFVERGKFGMLVEEGKAMGSERLGTRAEEARLGSKDCACYGQVGASR